MVRQQSSEQAFCSWAWETVSRLRLHFLERSDQACQFAMSNQSQAFSQVPDVDSDPSLTTLISQIREKQPIACYVALRMTTYGHSVPLICSQAFDLLQILMASHRYEQVLIVLSNIIPLFLECPESLLKHEKAVPLIATLTSADRTYVKMAKSLIGSEFPGPILKSFSNLIEFHVQNSNRCESSSI